MRLPPQVPGVLREEPGGHDLIRRACIAGLRRKGLEDERFLGRLEEELAELARYKESSSYVLDLFFQSQFFHHNENNILIYYALGLTDEFDIARPPIYQILIPAIPNTESGLGFSTDENITVTLAGYDEWFSQVYRPSRN